MIISKPFALLKPATALALSCLLSACGGANDFSPVVTGVKVQAAQYGKTATIYLAGKDLRSNLLVDTSGACTSPTFASNSNTDTVVLNCVVAKTGDFSLVVQTAEGAAIYSTTFNVPLPQVTLITA